VGLICAERDSATRKIADILGGEVTLKEYGRGRQKVRSYSLGFRDDGAVAAYGRRPPLLATSDHFASWPRPAIPVVCGTVTVRDRWWSPAECGGVPPA